jgi:hypothetical protein
VVVIVGAPGLGVVLFYLRFAPRPAAHGARLRFRGDPRLATMLRRSLPLASAQGGDAASEAGAGTPILVGDLPCVAPQESLPAPLALPPDARRVAAWRQRLGALGPRPWIGVTWRAGITSPDASQSLRKHVPLAPLMRALAPLGGTVIALQRGLQSAELASAGEALARAVHEIGGAADDIEEMLALVSILDRHVCVSNTNVHLAAGAGATPDVLVPFPPEWRWGASGDSPWFPAFRAHRQRADGNWSQALDELRR